MKNAIVLSSILAVLLVVPAYAMVDDSDPFATTRSRCSAGGGYLQNYQNGVDCLWGSSSSAPGAYSTAYGAGQVNGEQERIGSNGGKCGLREVKYSGGWSCSTGYVHEWQPWGDTLCQAQFGFNEESGTMCLPY